ncbi:MAG: hypothetical protein JWR85_1918 [Marmoricola sp.]|nr:hypothetical protein [Marmoricola sp.]
MKPIPQTVEAVAALGDTADGNLLKALQSLADEVRRIVPDCLGLSLAWTEFGVTFTLVASDAETAILDALQYLDSGPCVDAVRLDVGIRATQHDLFDEESWRLFAQGSAAAGVRSTLTIPLSDAGTIVGSANMYASSDDAFEGHEADLARILGGYAPGMVRNADLTFSTRNVAEQAPRKLQTDALLDRAIGFIAAKLGLDLGAAHERLREAARRAGITEEELANALLRLRP